MLLPLLPAVLIASAFPRSLLGVWSLSNLKALDLTSDFFDTHQNVSEPHSSVPYMCAKEPYTDRKRHTGKKAGSRVRRVWSGARW